MYVAWANSISNRQQLQYMFCVRTKSKDNSNTSKALYRNGLDGATSISIAWCWVSTFACFCMRDDDCFDCACVKHEPTQTHHGSYRPRRNDAIRSLTVSGNLVFSSLLNLVFSRCKAVGSYGPPPVFMCLPSTFYISRDQSNQGYMDSPPSSRTSSTV